MKLFDGTAGWSDARLAELKRTIELGWSRSQIASHLGGVSRNAVIGKAKRMGLESGVAPSAPRATRPQGIALTPKPQKARSAAPPAKPALRIAGNAAVFEEPEARTPRERPARADAFKPLRGSTPVEFGTPHACKWPIDGFDHPMSCGLRPAVRGDVYCTVHAEMGGTAPRTTGAALVKQLRRYA